MIHIKKNSISSDFELLGQELRQARMEKKISLAEAANRLRIGARYLEALEAGRLAELPAGIYGKKFLAEYARFLRIDIPPAFAACPGQDLDGARQPELFSVKKPRLHFFLTVPRLIKNSLIILAVLACLGYLGFCFQRVTAPPVLALEAPAADLVTRGNYIEIAGQAEPEAKITVNGESVLADAEGYFRKSVSLKTGLNTIIVTAQKQYSRKNILTRNIMVKNGDL